MCPMVTKLYLLRDVLILHMTGDRRDAVCVGRASGLNTVLSRSLHQPPLPGQPQSVSADHQHQHYHYYTSVTLLLYVYWQLLHICQLLKPDDDQYPYLSTEPLMLTTTHICQLNAWCWPILKSVNSVLFVSNITESCVSHCGIMFILN